MSLKGRKLNIFISLIMVASLVFTAIFVSYGATTKKITSTKQSAANRQAQASEASKKAASLYEKVGEAETKINKLESSITTKQAEINATKVKLEKKQKDVETQSKALNERLVAMYKTGTVGFVDVILSSNDVSELITNVGMVQKILNNDKDVLKSLKTDYKEIAALKSQQETQEKALEKDKKEVETTRASLKSQADEYKAKEQQLQASADSLAAKAARDQAAYDAKLDLKNNQSSSGGSSGGASSSNGYVWPCPGPITSYFGWRIHPIYGYKKYHDGVDIGASTGTDVRAIGNGYVTMAGTNGGYGNCVMIAIGGGRTTLYGHLSSFSVSRGQYVKKGQVVASVGSTGWSTGPHLHFSLIRNGTYVDPYSLTYSK